jgi:hypothetical protein
MEGHVFVQAVMPVQLHLYSSQRRIYSICIKINKKGYNFDNRFFFGHRTTKKIIIDASKTAGGLLMRYLYL